MRLDIRIASASAMVLTLMSPLTAGAAEPEDATIAQLSPRAANQGTVPTGRTGAEDQSPIPGNNTTGDQTLQEQSVPTSPPPRVGLFTGFGKTLIQDGIDIHGIAFDHFLGNPTAGANPGHSFNLAAFRPAADFDLNKLIGIPGGNIHLGLTFFGLRGDTPQDIVQAGGFLTGFQTTPATETNLLSLLTYEQRFMNGKLSVEAGRTSVFNYFLLPNSLDPFANYSGTFVVTGDFPSTPYPVWGGRATYKFAPTWYVQGGLFEDNYAAATSYGDRLGIGRSPGAQILAEVGQRSEFSNAAYPSNLEAGVEWNTRDGRLNLKGTGAPAIPLLQRPNYPGGGVVFLQGEKVVWRGAGHPGSVPLAPPTNIALYGALNVSVSKPQPIDMDATAGVILTGFVPTRPFDALELQAKYQRLSQVEADGESRKQLITAGRGPSQNRDGFAFEAVANLQVTPAFAIRPLVEYFVNPDNYYPPAPIPRRPRDGIEAGLFAVVSLGRLLGTSAKPF
jgi:porin